MHSTPTTAEGAASTTPRVLLAVSLKMYLGAARTRQWIADVARIAAGHDSVEVAVLPTFPVLESTRTALQDTAVRWGAQDLAPTLDGAQTGEVSAEVLVELGCTYAEIGHAERRRLFGECDAMVVDKLRTAARAGLRPLLCVGEPERLAPQLAAEQVASELRHLLRQAYPDGAPEVVVAYEPIWAIGAAASADADHVRAVAGALRGVLDELGIRGRVIYGGAAGTTTLDELWPAVDGLFLGRFAHDPAAVETLIGRAEQLLAVGAH